MPKQLIMLVFIFVMLSACSQSSGFVGEKEINESDKLEGYNRTIQFPTYVPFDVKETSLTIENRGPFELKDGEPVYKRDEPKFKMIKTRYVSNDTPIKILEIDQSSSTFNPIQANHGYSEDELIDIGDGLRGLYHFNGRTQIFTWEDSGTTFSLYLMVGKETHKKEPIPKEKIFEIARSFKGYKGSK
ncbi:hypothetical protein ACFO3D_13825 [Virgibacillus kekensis]|uniref:Lipoprotein n=1 Tax=Virgibacillus kekensis TaxID=202261 RepID=A0ABV9DNZ5_9BACI